MVGENGRNDIEATGQELFKNKGVVSSANYQRESKRDKDRLF